MAVSVKRTSNHRKIHRIHRNIHGENSGRQSTGRSNGLVIAWLANGALIRSITNQSDRRVIGEYRGSDRKSDRKINDINHRLIMKSCLLAGVNWPALCGNG